MLNGAGLNALIFPEKECNSLPFIHVSSISHLRRHLQLALTKLRVDSYGPTAMGRTWKDYHGSIGPHWAPLAHGPGRGLDDESYKIIKASSLAA